MEAYLLYQDNENTKSNGICQLSVSALVWQGLFLLLVCLVYSILSLRVMEVCLNYRLINVLSQVQWWGAGGIVLSLLCRASLLLPDLDDHQDIVKILLHVDTLINTTTATLGVHTFAIRPVIDAAIVP